jgi:hypothetical protein
MLSFHEVGCVSLTVKTSCNKSSAHSSAIFS